MKIFLQVITTMAICFVLQAFLPWWTMAIGAGVAGYIFGNNGYVSFLAGLIGVSLLWIGMSFYIDTVTHSILTEKVNKLFPVNVFILTAVVGGLVGGLGALTGALLKRK